LEVEDMPGVNGRDGRVEMALWIHDTGEAYRVHVYRWKQGKLVPALDVYPYYFKKVAAYYQRKTEENPFGAFYWYYLADAQFKAGWHRQALKSIEEAFRLNPGEPWLKALNELKSQILHPTERRAAPSLYPVSVKTVKGTKWGYIDDRGKMVLPPQYDQADLNKGRIFQLKDLFKPGSNYVQTLSDYIRKQIKENPEYSYIKADQPFYVTEEALVLYFFPYEIASYAAGFPMFKIPYADIMNRIDVNGEFWRSFH
jgi:tetratricopeptide (TPR) repeat protein